jgi:hypothetical protein
MQLLCNLKLQQQILRHQFLRLRLRHQRKVNTCRFSSRELGDLNHSPPRSHQQQLRQHWLGH